LKARTILLITLAALLVGGAVVYFFFDPASSPVFPKCPFLVLTGWKCPGCGTQRAIHALLHGDLATAWHYNAAMVCALPYVALLLTAELVRPRLPRLYNFANSTTLIYLSLILILLWWLLRNLLSL